MRKSPITTAIIPVAGLGTRFLPATKAQPKEMLPLVDKPMIQYIVEEAVAAGISQVVFVTSIGKRAIEDHFDRNFELEYRLEQQKRVAELRTVSEIGKMAKFAFVRQAKPLGDGDAVLAAMPFVKEEACAVLFGDDVIEAPKPAIAQLIETFEAHHAPVILVGRIPREEVSKYGVISSTKAEAGTHRITGIVEKPSAKAAPSNLCIIGRYIITSDLVKRLRTKSADVSRGQEVRLADAFQSALRDGEPVYARELKGVWHECGNKLGFMKAAISYGLKHPEIKDGLRTHLENLCK